MHVLLVSSNTERISMVAIPLGLGMVAAATRRAGHEVTFLDLVAEADPVAAVHRAIDAFAPDVIGISVRNIDDQTREAPRFLLSQVKPVVEACHASTHAPVVLGGTGFSIFPAAALGFLGADYGVAGEGESAFPALIACLEEGRDPSGSPGIHVAGRASALEPSFTDDLTSLPQWDEALRAVANPGSEDLWIPVQSRRGCPNDCSYCSTARIQGRRIRTRRPEDVAEHVARLAAAGFARFYFVDNSFNIPEAYALELARLLGNVAPRVTWRCILYPHLVRKELVLAMAEAGCVEVSLGFESGNPAVLREMNKRFTPEDVRRVSGLLAAHGIRRIGFLLLGGPGETRESVEESLAFASSLNLDALRITVGIRIYPGTRLAKRAIAEKVIAPEDDLLYPRFYLAPALEPWIHERVAALSVPA
ncbi:MAG: B12-binding domain-containing radical SAM protein [Thermoanaerobaculia bacterium]